MAGAVIMSAAVSVACTAHLVEHASEEVAHARHDSVDVCIALASEGRAGTEECSAAAPLAIFCSGATARSARGRPPFAEESAARARV